MADNAKTGFKARELKSVHVDAIGRYLRLVIHKNHVNKYNLYNQVGEKSPGCVCHKTFVMYVHNQWNSTV